MKKGKILPRNTIILHIVLILTFSLVFISYINLPITAKYNKTFEEISAPDWNIGDRWSYFANFSFKMYDDVLELECDNLEIIVDSVYESYYTLYFNGSVDGSGKLNIKGGIFRINKLDGFIEGYIDLGRTNFSLKNIYDVSVSGQVKVGNPSVTTDFKINIDDAYLTPNIIFIEFPLEIGKNWSTPSADINVYGNSIIAGSEEDINISESDAIPGFDFTCNDTTNFFLGSYGTNVISYNILEKTNKISMMYAPNISSIVKLSFNELKFSNFTISGDLYLKNTSYIDYDLELSVELVNPKEGSVYLGKHRLFRRNKLFSTLLIGRINLEAKVKGVYDDVSVSFYVNDECKKTLTKSPYVYTLDEKIFGKNCEIRVVAEDSLDRIAEDYISATLLIV